jgi:hypothetical protein
MEFESWSFRKNQGYAYNTAALNYQQYNWLYNDEYPGILIPKNDEAIFFLEAFNGKTVTEIGAIYQDYYNNGYHYLDYHENWYSNDPNRNMYIQSTWINSFYL